MVKTHDVIQLNCKNCAAPLKNDNHKCDFCGSDFRIVSKEISIDKYKHAYGCQINSKKTEPIKNNGKWKDLPYWAKICVVLMFLLSPLYFSYLNKRQIC